LLLLNNALPSTTCQNRTRTVNTRHFTAYGQTNTAVSATQAGAQTVKLMNPVECIGTSGATTAAYWRVRQDTADRDTSLAIPPDPGNEAR